MQRQNEPTISLNQLHAFAQILKKAVTQQLHTVEEHISKPRAALYHQIREFARQIDTKTKQSLPELLANISDTCTALLALNPAIWSENNEFALEYKKIFYHLNPEELKIVGAVHPNKKPKLRHVVFNIRNDNQIEIIRPYPDYEYLVYEGGGVKGAAYGGVNEALVEAGVMQTITTIAGSSAGAITATLVAMGYSDKAFKKEIDRVDFNRLQDVVNPGGIIGKNLGIEVGLFAEVVAGAGPANEQVHGEAFINSGRSLYLKLVELIQAGVKRIMDRATPAQRQLMREHGVEEAYTNKKITFDDLHKLAIICPEENIRELIVTGSHVIEPSQKKMVNGKEEIIPGRTRLELFSHQHSPNTEIAKALRISASIPKFFRSVEHNGKTYIDGGVEQNLPYSIFTEINGQPDLQRIPKVIGLKFLPPEDIDKGVMQLPHKQSEIKWGESKFTPEWAETITENRNRESNRLRGEAAPLVIPVSNENIKSTEFNLSSEKKAALIQQGYTRTKAILAEYLDPERVVLSADTYPDIKIAIDELSLEEVKTLLVHMNETQQAKVILREFNVQENLSKVNNGKIKQYLEQRLNSLVAAEKAPVSAAQLLAEKKARERARLQKLKRFFADDESAMTTQLAVLKKLRKQENIWRHVGIDPNLIKGADIQNILLGREQPFELLKQSFGVKGELFVSHIQDEICKVLAEQMGFEQPLAVKDAVFLLERERQAQRWEALVDKNGGFNINLLKAPEVIAYIKSMPNYLELQSWAARNPDSLRARLIENLFEDIALGNLDWFITLSRCVRGTLSRADCDALPEQGNDTIKNVARLYYNSKNSRAEESNLQQLLSEIAAELNTFILENLIRKATPEKHADDVKQHSLMMKQISEPFKESRKATISTPTSFRVFDTGLGEKERKLKNYQDQITAVRDALKDLSQLKSEMIAASRQLSQHELHQMPNTIVKLTLQIENLNKQLKELNDRVQEAQTEILRSSPLNARRPT